MANWYVIRDGTDMGPFDDAGLRQLAKTGKLGRDELVHKEGITQSAKAGNIKGLFPPETPAAAPESAPATKPAQGSDIPPVARSALNRLQGAAKGIARAASIKKLQLHDLPQADLAIGTRAYQLTLGGEGLEKLFADVRRVEAEVEVKRKSITAPAHETLGDRTKRLAAEAKKRIDAERLLKQRKQLLTDAGGQIREGSDDGAKEQLSAEIAAAQLIIDNLAALEIEDKQQSGGASPMRRLVLAGAAIPLILIGLWFLMDLVTTSPEEQHLAALEKISADAETTRLERAAERAADDRSDKEEQERQAAELALEEAELDANQARQKREEAAARRQDEVTREKARLKEQQEAATAAAEKEATSRADAAKETAEQNREQLRLQDEHDKAQRARVELANTLFAKVNLDPNSIFELSASAKKAGAKLELRSPELSKLQKLLADKNWLDLIGHFNDATYDEYPEASQMERAFDSLHNHQFHLLVRIDRRYLGIDRGPRLCSITFPTEREHEDFESPNVANVSESWDAHPDGIGVTRIWRLTDGPAVIALADPERIDDGIRNVKQQLGQQYLSLDKKAKLGEVDGELITPEMRKAIVEAQAKLKAAGLKL